MLTRNAKASGPVMNISSVAVNSQANVDQASAIVSNTEASMTTSYRAFSPSGSRAARRAHHPPSAAHRPPPAAAGLADDGGARVGDRHDGRAADDGAARRREGCGAGRRLRRGLLLRRI